MFLALVAPSPQIELEGDWQRYSCVLSQVPGVQYLVTIAEDDHGALVRLASTGALVKVTGGEVTMLNQSRVRMKLELLERQQHCQALEMVEVD